MSRIRNLKTWVKCALVVILLLPIGLVVWTYLVKGHFWCGGGYDVRRIDEQCIGVTDGQVELRPDLAGVLQQIRQENDRAARKDPNAVSVAYLVPLPKTESDDQRLLHELQGAYKAQSTMNHQSDRPLIRLLVANSGEESAHWREVVPELLERRNGTERVVTVVATGDTLESTLDAIGALRDEGLPVVLSRLSGDTLADHEEDLPLGGLARLAPSGRDQGAAAAAYLKKTASTALLIRDDNPDDPYVRTFYEAFEREFPDEDGTHTIKNPPQTYDSRHPVANLMGGIVRNICRSGQEPDAVLFAGRADAMTHFVEKLSEVPCDKQLKVMAPDGSVALAGKIAEGNQELAGNLNKALEQVSFLYTAQTHPGAWRDAPKFFSGDTIDRLTEECGNDRCVDGGVVIGYDAILTATTAIRPQEETPSTVEPGSVSQALRRLHGEEAVPGAAGWISLDDRGNPVNKAVVILEVREGGKVKFVQMSSPFPLGQPCIPRETPCE